MADAKTLLEFARVRLGHIDISVADAGISNNKGVTIENLTERDGNEMVRVNLQGFDTVVHTTLFRYAEVTRKPEEVGGNAVCGFRLATFLTGEAINVNGGSFLCG